MLLIGSLMAAYTIYVNNVCRRERLIDAAWLRKVAVAHMPHGETVEWEGCSERVGVTNKAQRKALWPMTFAIAMVTMPSLVWILKGLPNITDGKYHQ